MSKYFSNCATNEELKKAFKEWCKKLHPDNGGDVEEFKQMKAEFEQMFDKVGNVFRNKQGETYTKANYHETAKEYMDIIEKIINYKGCIIELIGTWLWVSGNTRDYKDALKSLGFKYQAKKTAWYMTKDEMTYKKKHKSNYTMNDIRAMWGSEIIDSDKDRVIEG